MGHDSDFCVTELNLDLICISFFFTFGDQRLLEMLVLYREAPYLRRSVWIPVILAIVMVEAIINVDRSLFDCHLYSEVTRGHC